jgi:hypothetical protein
VGRANGQPTVGRARALSLGLPQLRIEHLWMLLPLLVVAWMGFMHPLRLLDFWWHLKAGEIIVTLGEIPRVDLFSFTRAGQPFVYQNWLTEVLYYLTYRTGSLPLVIAFNTLVLLATLALTFSLCLRATQRLHVAVLCGLVAAVTVGLYSNVRPQACSFAFFAAFFYILTHYRDRRRDLLWALPPLMILWVNLHGAFVLGIGLIGVVLACETLRRLFRGPRADTMDRAALARLAFILGLTVLASLFNPESYGVYAYVRQLQVDPASQLFVSEWQVPNIKDIGDVWAFFGLFFLALLVFFYSGSRLDLTELGVFLTFAVLGLAGRRYGIWFAIVAMPLVARHWPEWAIPDLLEEQPGRPCLESLVRRLRERQSGKHPTRRGVNWTILAALVLLTVILSPWVRPHLGVKGLRPQLIEQGTPVGAMDYIEAHGLSGNIFHPQLYGDYLIWRLWPQQRSFVDGRVHLYDESFVQDYVLTLHDEQWESRLAEYDIKYLLLPKDYESSRSMIEDARASASWTLLYEDDISILFEWQF